MIALIATGEIDDRPEDDAEDPAAKALGKRGGAARAKAMTPERRAEFARNAAAKRWGALGLFCKFVNLILQQIQ
jgi:hypothetical protein